MFSNLFQCFKKIQKLETGTPTIPGGGYWGTPGNCGKQSYVFRRDVGTCWEMLEKSKNLKCSNIFYV